MARKGAEERQKVELCSNRRAEVDDMGGGAERKAEKLSSGDEIRSRKQEQANINRK
jgi:hypothetical protein